MHVASVVPNRKCQWKQLNKTSYKGVKVPTDGGHTVTGRDRICQISDPTSEMERSVSIFISGTASGSARGRDRRDAQSQRRERLDSISCQLDFLFPSQVAM